MYQKGKKNRRMKCSTVIVLLLIIVCEWVPLPKLTVLGSRVRTQYICVGYPMLLGSRQELVLIDGTVVRSSDV